MQALSRTFREIVMMEETRRKSTNWGKQETEKVILCCHSICHFCPKTTDQRSYTYFPHWKRESGVSSQRDRNRYRNRISPTSHSVKTQVQNSFLSESVEDHFVSSLHEKQREIARSESDKAVRELNQTGEVEGERKTGTRTPDWILVPVPLFVDVVHVLAVVVRKSP
jgi:hypothetical protein